MLLKSKQKTDKHSCVTKSPYIYYRYLSENFNFRNNFTKFSAGLILLIQYKYSAIQLTCIVSIVKYNHSMTHTVYIALGTNLGERLDNLRTAIAALAPGVLMLTKSHVYETPPWGYEDQPAFLNMVVKVETGLEPEPLLTYLKQIEAGLGREKSVRWGPRLIDLDILFYDDLVIDTPPLVIPHPRLHERAFVLVPLADVAPDSLILFSGEA